MIIDAARFIRCPVLSVHIGGQIAFVTDIIVNPDNLKIAAFRVDGPEVGGEVGDLLQTKDVREYSDLGMVVDSIDEFVNEADVIWLQKILKLGFLIDGIAVETKKGTKLGKVQSYTVNTEDYSILQLIVKRPFFKSLVDPELVISRSEVVKVTDDKIIVRDEESKIREKAAKEDFVPNFVNPFREPNLSTADMKNLDE